MIHRDAMDQGHQAPRVETMAKNESESEEYNSRIPPEAKQ